MLDGLVRARPLAESGLELERKARRTAHAAALGGLGCVALAFSNVGCATSHMREVHPSQAIAASAGIATILFIRPHRYPAAVQYTVLDTQAGPSGREVRFLGESAPSSHFAAAVSPGEHLFLGSGGGNLDVLRARVSAGRMYLVEIDTGPFKGLELRAIPQGSALWKDAHVWIDETTQLVPDRLAGQADLMRNPEPVDETITDALERLRSYDADDLAERTLNPNDGR